MIVLNFCAHHEKEFSKLSLPIQNLLSILNNTAQTDSSQVQPISKHAPSKLSRLTKNYRKQNTPEIEVTTILSLNQRDVPTKIFDSRLNLTSNNFRFSTDSYQKVHRCSCVTPLFLFFIKHSLTILIKKE